jgi:hypothetical protein
VGGPPGPYGTGARSAKSADTRIGSPAWSSVGVRIDPIRRRRGVGRARRLSSRPPGRTGVRRCRREARCAFGDGCGGVAELRENLGWVFAGGEHGHVGRLQLWTLVGGNVRRPARLCRHGGQDGGVELDAFLAVAVELLAVPSTAERPEQLRRAVESVVDFVGPGFSVERFESNGKPSAVGYADVSPSGRQLLGRR